MAMGLPVITTQGTPWAVLKEQHLGWWVPATVDGIEAGLLAATAESPDRLAERGRRARDYATQSFAWPAIGTRMAACYAWLLGLGPVPPDVVFA
jgi:glycosyltransferase involved in cell wall biosynthesis